jgi:uncharacterized glyoxalase superfamily protein PhnB
MPTSPNVWPSMSYRDAPAAVEFLTNAFGFVAKGVYHDDDDPSRIVHAQLDWPPGGGVMFGSSGRPAGMADPTGHASAYCSMDDTIDLDELFERATKAGAEVVRPVTEQDYGGRNFIVKDPEGNQWSFGDYLGE